MISDKGFTIIDFSGFMGTLCPNELSAFNKWLDEFKAVGGFNFGNEHASILYDFFMAGESAITAKNKLTSKRKPFKYTKWLSFVNGEYKQKCQDELVDMYIKYLEGFKK